MSGGAAPGPRPTILIADDEAVVRMLMVAVLSEDRYNCLESADGIAAMELITVHRPALVILDARMPGLDGFQVCERMKQDLDLALIPVIMLTGDAEDEPRALAVGADRYFPKPVQLGELLNVIEQLLRPPDESLLQN